MRRLCLTTVSAFSFAAVALAYPGIAAADVFNLDEFAVTRNGTQIFDDSFNQNASLIGGSGTVVPSGTDFSNCHAANYFVHGAITETTANNGQATLDTANGFQISQPDPFIPAGIKSEWRPASNRKPRPD